MSLKRNKKKIAIFIDELIPGSSPKFTTYPIKYLAALGYDVTILILFKNNTIEEKKILKEFIINKKISYRFISDKFPVFFKKKFKIPYMDFFSIHHIIGFFFSHLSVKKKEFLFILGYQQYSFFSLINIKFLRKIDHILMIWDPSINTAEKIFKNKMNFIYFQIFKFFCFCLDYLSCLFPLSLMSSNKNYKNNLLKYNKNIFFNYPGSNEYNSTFKIKRKKSIFVFDRWDSGNNPQAFLYLLKLILQKHKKFKLIIGGSWLSNQMKKKFIKTISDLNLNKSVSLLGYLNDKEIYKYSTSSMFHAVLVHEAFGMPSLEVSKYGCVPFIVKKSGCNDILNLPNMLILDDKNDNVKLKKIYKSITYLLENDKLYRKLSKEISSKAKKASWKKFALTLIENYKKFK